LSPQYGWASTHVVAYEIVLSNRSVVTVTATSDPDLYRALQTGGNTLGVVTAFVLRTFPQGQVGAKFDIS